jgi:hypothetical protein
MKLRNKNHMLNKNQRKNSQIRKQQLNRKKRLSKSQSLSQRRSKSLPLRRMKTRRSKMLELLPEWELSYPISLPRLEHYLVSRTEPYYILLI